MTDPEETLWQYLPHATIGEVATQSWLAFRVWLALSGVTVAIGLACAFMYDLFFGSMTSDFGAFIPRWVWITLVFSGVSWCYQGISWPKLGWRAWLSCTLMLAVVLASFEYGPWWFSMPTLFAIAAIETSLDTLNVKGRNNYRMQSTVEATPG